MIGNRLKEERIRLGLTQTQLAEIGGVKKLSQINYELDRRVPDTNYLALVADEGVDICYIITGQKNLGSSARLDKNILKKVMPVLLDWMSKTDREITAELLSDILFILYEAAYLHMDEEYLKTQVQIVG